MKSIFIHGLGQDAASFDKTISYMEKSTETVCPDLPLLLQETECTYDNLYHAFEKFLQSIPAPFHLCGLSLGAVLALHYAIEHPKKVSALILIGGQYKMPAALLKFQNMIFRFLPEASFQSTGFQKEDFIKLTNSMQALNFEKHLQDITCDTLIVCGQKDRPNQKASITMSECIPNAKLHIIKNAGHELNKEAPEVLAKVLDSFINSNNVS